MTPRIRLDSDLWNNLLVELSARGAGTRESAAFLLVPKGDTAVATEVVTEIAYLDDLDATCLTGGITFSADGQSKLLALCRVRALKVVADVHTHPGPWVDQSRIDAAHPMVAVAGHVALIVPNYGQHQPHLEDVGVHIYLGDGRWDSTFGPGVRNLIELRDKPLSGPAHRYRGRPVSRLVARLVRVLVRVLVRRSS
jgi:proteasome lid subunit RPN8/RPN11